jgi:protocatechuate 3,4-dioxygenase beta subunit
MTKLKLAVLPLFLATLLLSGASAFALIVTGGKGPMDNADWPRGADELANLKSRFRWTEGPPFGGGEYRFEYSGGTAAFQEALEALAAIHAPKRELVVFDGPGKMCAVNDNEQRPVDWNFTIWSAAAYYRLYSRPDTGPITDEDPNYGEPLPPPRVHVYLWKDGGVNWKDVKVPAGIDVVDRRDESAREKPEGGGLIIGTVYDMATGKPVSGALISLEQWRGDPKPEANASTADEDGNFRIERVQKGSFYVHAGAEGYSTRLAGTYYNEGLTFQEETVYLAPARTLEGKAVDPDGKPVAGVKIQVGALRGMDGKGYPRPRKDGRANCTSDENGRFQIPGLPQGYAQLFTLGEWRCEDQNRVFPTADPFAVSRNNEVRLTVQRTGEIHGRVVVPDGATLPPNTEVRLVRLDSPNIQHFADGHSVGPDGKFSAPSMLPGEYLVDLFDAAKRDIIWRSDRPRLDELVNAIEQAPGTRRVSLKPGGSAEVDLTYTP